MPNGSESARVEHPGAVVAIGGAEDKVGKRGVLKAFLSLAGGHDARIALVPTASSMGTEVVATYDALFRKLGAADVIAVQPTSRQAASDPGLAALLDDVTAVFMTGGNQLKLSAVVNGTLLGDAIVRAHERGATVAGTSAGASILSSHMVAFGPGGATPKQRMTQVAAGLGLVRGAVIDQHFDQRNRYGRLLTIVAQSPSLLGLGIDEDTAAVLTRCEGHQVLRVTGRGAVTIFDGQHLVSDAAEARQHAPLLASGVVLHVLPDGAAFDLTARCLVQGPPIPSRPTRSRHRHEGATTS